jgi:hypothetical protein
MCKWKWHTTEFCENCAVEFCCTDECKYHLLHRVKQARDQIAARASTLSKHDENDTETVRMFKDAKASSYEDCVEILNKLIEESEEYIKPYVERRYY